MARFYITPDSESHQIANSACADAALQPDGEVVDGNLHLTTYTKRAIDSRNFHQFDNGNFVATTGTIILNGLMGADALTEVYKLYEESGPAAVRDQAFGHYAVIIKCDDTVEIFCDPNSVYHLYYSNGENWFVSNSLSLCGRVLDERVIDRHALYERIIESTEVSKRTLFRDVSRLSAREKITVDVSSNQFRLERLPLPPQDWSYATASIDEILADYKAKMRDVFGQMVSAADGIGIQATGGLDSRTVLAGVLERNGTPALLYGVGNSKLTNTKDEDRDVVQRYADRYGLSYYEMDWSGDFPIDIADWDELFRKYGFRYRFYGAIPSFFTELEQGFPDNPELILDGYAFGTHSNVFYWEDDSLVPLTFEDLVTDVFTAAGGFSTPAFRCKDEYLEGLIDVCEEALVELGEDIDRDELLDRQDLTRYIQLLNGRPQSTYTNIGNEFTYHLGPFATYNLGRPMVDFPPESRISEHIRVKLLREMYPDLLEVPVFSGTREQRFTDDDKLEPASPERVAMLAGSVLPESVVERIRPFYDSLIKGNTASNTELIFRYHEDRLADDGPIAECFDLKHYDAHMRRHSRFALFEHGVSRLGYSEVTSRQ